MNTEEAHQVGLGMQQGEGQLPWHALLILLIIIGDIQLLILHMHHQIQD